MNTCLYGKRLCIQLHASSCTLGMCDVSYLTEITKKILVSEPQHMSYNNILTNNLSLCGHVLF